MSDISDFKEKEKEYQDQIVELKKEINKVKEESELESKGFQDILKSKSEEINELKLKLRSATMDGPDKSRKNSTKNTKQVDDDGMDETMKQMKILMDSQVNQIRALQQEMKKKNQEKSQMEEILKANEKIISEMQLKKDERKEEIENLTKENQKLKEEAAHFDEEKEKILEENQKYQKQVQDIHKSAELIKESQQKVIDSLKEEIRKLAEREKELVEKISKLEEGNGNKGESDLQSEEEKKEENAVLNDLVSNFLLKINFGVYSISIFDLIETIVLEIDKFDKITSNQNSSATMNNLLLDIFNDIKFYTLFIGGNKGSLSDYLNHKVVHIEGKPTKNIDDVKKVKMLKSNSNAILSMYKIKKDNFFKAAEISFNIIKDYIYNKYSKDNELQAYISKINKIFLCTENEDKSLSIVMNFETYHQDNIKVPTNIFSYTVNRYMKRASKVKIIFSVSHSPFEINAILYSILLYSQKISELVLIFNKNAKEESYNLFQVHFSFIINSCSSLAYLHIENFPLKVPHEYFLEFVNELRNSKIEKLSIINSLSSKTLVSLSSYLINNLKLLELNLSSNNLNIPSQIFSTLNSNMALRSLNLSNNNLSNSDFDKLTTYLQETKTLQVLDVSNNQISTKSANALGIGVKKCESLSKLTMVNCTLTEESIIFFYDRSSAHVIDMKVDKNPIGDSSLMGTGSFLKFNKNLKTLSFRDCNISLIGISTFLVNLSYCPAVGVEVHFEDNVKIENDMMNVFDKYRAKLIDSRYSLFFSAKKVDEETCKNWEKYEFIKLVQS